MRWLGPVLGEHNDEVLGALGYEAQASARFKRDGVLWVHEYGRMRADAGPRPVVRRVHACMYRHLTEIKLCGDRSACADSGC